jgi:hypothetical protein
MRLPPRPEIGIWSKEPFDGAEGRQKDEQANQGHCFGQSVHLEPPLVHDPPANNVALKSSFKSHPFSRAG